jgi:TonB family protein
MKMTLRAASAIVYLLTVNSPVPVQAQQDATISDKEVKVVGYESLKYPALALQTSYQGVVVVRVKLDDSGKVIETAAISGHELLIPDCLANARKWRFQPNAHHAAVIVYRFQLSFAAKCQSEGSFFTLETPNFVTIVDCVKTIQ